jgi:phosphomannomutase
MADGGIILTASHNPKQWNALKLLNDKGEFLSALTMENKFWTSLMLKSFSFAGVDDLGLVSEKDYTDRHIELGAVARLSGYSCHSYSRLFSCN